MVRWWPPVGLILMVILGLVVGRGSTRLDDVFRGADDLHPGHVPGFRSWLLWFTDARLLLVAFVVAVVVALAGRRWRLAAVIVAAPIFALAIVRLSKPLFGRIKGGVNGEALAYPSGHSTLVVVVSGMLVLVAGGRLWALAAAVVVSLLGVLGQALTFHYFTDTVGGALLGTSVVCLAATIAGKGYRRLPTSASI